jgi:ribosomal protein S5
LGTNNKASNVYATMEALKRLATRYNREQQKRKEKHAAK